MRTTQNFLYFVLHFRFYFLTSHVEKKETDMKVMRYILLLAVVLLCGCTEDPILTEQGPGSMQTMTYKINMTIDGKTQRVTLFINEATETLLTTLGLAPLTYEANDFGGFEKVGPLGRSLPVNDTQINAQPGDILLYHGDQIIVFYGANIWEYTRLGRIEGLSTEELKTFLKAGEGNVKITLSLIE